MSDLVVQLAGMTTNHRFTRRLTNAPFQLPQRRRVPRGLVRLRALRLRLVASTCPHFQQTEFQFGK